MTPEEIELLIQERNLYLRECQLHRNGSTANGSHKNITRLTAENLQLRAEVAYWKRHSRKHELSAKENRTELKDIKATQTTEGIHND